LAVVFLTIFSISLIFSLILTREVRDFATRRGWVARPVLERHLHSRPLPRLGGVAIFLSFLLSLLAAFVIQLVSPAGTYFFSAKTVLAILLPGALILLLGVYDDVRSAGPYAKFAVQGVAGGLLFLGGLRIVDVPLLFGSYHLPWFLSLPLTIAWVLAITNAFNLIDGLDGLAAGSALFSTLVFFVVALISHSDFASLTSLILAGAILGFLRYNFNPATIFLGDCGSLFIGFILSALALEGAQKAPTIVAVAIPVVSFGLPILETAISILRRFLSGRPVFTGDREHIHHKLLQLGLSHRQVVIVLYAVSAVFALLSLFLLWPTGKTLALVLTVLGCGIWMGVQHLGYLEFGELRRIAQRTIEQRQTLINNLAIRRATEELKKARDYAQVCRILVAAFDANEFEAFDVYLYASLTEVPTGNVLQVVSSSSEDSLQHWQKPASYFGHELASAWSLKLDLVTTRNRRWGSITLYRMYGGRDLQLDINLLTSIFPIALADALERTLHSRVEEITHMDSPAEFAVARAG